jgi:hypothetical protein
LRLDESSRRVTEARLASTIPSPLPGDAKLKRMTNVLPHSESVRRALAWISQRREAEPQHSILSIVEEASLRFDLTPNEAEWLRHTLSQKP